MQRMESAHRDQPVEDLKSADKFEEIGRIIGVAGGIAEPKARPIAER